MEYPFVEHQSIKAQRKEEAAGDQVVFVVP
jgi:hypothetical protein